MNEDFSQVDKKLVELITYFIDEHSDYVALKLMESLKELRSAVKYMELLEKQKANGTYERSQT